MFFEECVKNFSLYCLVFSVTLVKWQVLRGLCSFFSSLFCAKRLFDELVTRVLRVIYQYLEQKSSGCQLYDFNL